MMAPVSSCDADSVAFTSTSCFVESLTFGTMAWHHVRTRGMMLGCLLLLTTTVQTASAAAAENHVELNVTRLDCTMRALALQYAQKIQSWRSPEDEVFDQIHDALRLTDLCGIEKPSKATTALTDAFQQSRTTTSVQRMTRRTFVELPPSCLPEKKRHCIYVSPSSSFQEQDGSIDAPVATLQDALDISRTRLDSSRTTIVLRQGIHQVESTIALGPADSGLEITGYPNEEVWISGGISIANNNWKPWDQNSKIFVTNLTDILKNKKIPKVASVFTTYPHRRLVRARFPNSNPETDQWGYASKNNLVYSIAADVVTEWQVPPKGQPPKFELLNLTVPPHGVPSKNDSTMDEYNVYASGSGGVCADLWGPEANSYWCSNASAGGWSEVDLECAVKGRLQIPIGMKYNTSTKVGRRLQSWGNQAQGGIVHAWHSQSWSMHMFEISTVKEKDTFWFAKGGGKQGGRNWCRCDQCTYAAPWCGQNQDPPINTDKRLISGTWLVENVLVELDQPGEFYFDPTTNLLYVIPNATDYLNNLRFALLENILELRNVSNITISNIGFRDSAATFMSDWSAPSGGDWSLHRGGALFLENVNNITVASCRFRRLDGNAVFLSKRTRHVTIERSVFEWIGENAIATWGDTKGYDATNGNQPHYTLVRDNVMRELGIYQKQSSAWAQSKAAMSTVRNNIMFNMPRAAINLNDMMGGGDVIESNLIFNTCRESGDHGPINTWDRQPFMTTLRDGKTASFEPRMRIIAHNYIFANYGASQAVDNDDGSSWYHIHDNVFYAAEGFKMDYGGHDSVFERNLVMAYPYDGQQCVSFYLATFKPGHGHVAHGNKCIVGLGEHYIDSGCGDPSCADEEPDAPEDLEHVVSLQCKDSHVGLYNNSYYTPNGTATFLCSDDDADNGYYSLDDLQKTFKLEIGSKCDKTPSDSTMAKWANNILF